MRVLLDTNAFLRWAADAPLPKQTERILKRSDTDLSVSIVTGWEIVLKARLGKTAADFAAALQEMGARLQPVKVAHLEVLSQLEWRKEHRDPFDRMLIAQALSEELAVVTSDSRFQEYRGLRVIWD